MADTISAETAGIRPFWVPESVYFDKLPEGLRAAVQAILAPVYQQLVLDESNPLLRAQGEQCVFLIGQWLLSQYQLGKLTWSGLANGENTEAIQKITDGYMRLIAAHDRSTNSLLRFKVILAELGTTPS